jgi:hypothetical protein
VGYSVVFGRGVQNGLICALVWNAADGCGDRSCAGAGAAASGDLIDQVACVLFGLLAGIGQHRPAMLVQAP